MVTRVELEPLRVQFTFPNGGDWTADLSDTANPQLAEDLAHGLVQIVHPLGRIAARGSVQVYASTIRRMAEELAEAGFHGGLADLRKRHMLLYWMSVTGRRVAMTRRLLFGCGERVDKELRAHLDGKAVKSKPQTKPLQPYTESEWRAIESALREHVKKQWAAQREALALAERGPDAGDAGVNRQNFAWLLHQEGPLRVEDAITRLHVNKRVFTGGVGVDFIAMRHALYPPVSAVMALRLLFGVYSGVVPDGIRDLGREDITWAGDHSVLLDYVKAPVSYP